MYGKAPSLGSRKPQHSFAQIPAVHTERSVFDRSFTIKDTFDFDVLVPIFVDEILPGDTANVSLNTFARLATQIVPIMDNLYIDYFFFFVPNRLVWSNWEKFNGAQDNPGDSTSFVIPTLAAVGAGGYTNGSIYDKMGLPTGVTSALSYINALPFRAYNLIYNTWFRDQNMQNSVTVQIDNGPDPIANYSLLARGKRHDYFTSCLPWPQKGTAVQLPLGTSATVKSTGVTPKFSTASMTDRDFRSSASGTNITYLGGASGPDAAAYFGSVTGLYTDLSTAVGPTINSLRLAFQTQAMLELDARGGTRYVEILQAHFNVTSPDFRLQRPEFLGGGSSKINPHPVAQTAISSGTNPLGQLGSFATSQGHNIGFTKSFVEHGYVIGLAQARADLTYQQGINRMWLRQTRFDFFWPKLQQIGEQAVTQGEIYSDGTANDLGVVFGYQERHACYRFKPSEIHGQFRSTYSTPLDVWHMAQKFAVAPTLNSTFISSSTPIARSIAVTSTGATLLFDAYFSYKHARPMMTYATPATLGRF